ncbi:hypothetical protein PJL18_03252 [Paenarthrobacter nicotinovorans]|nr:hypothetical protein [Paenarthrobacter nicotinovorans]
MLQQRVPALWRVSHSEVFGGSTVEPAAIQEVTAFRSSGGQKLCAEELIGDLVGVQQALALAHFLAAGTRPAVFVPQLVTDPGRELFHGFVEGTVIHLLDEGNGVAILAAAEAVVPAHLRADGEGGGTFVMERAQAFETAQSGTLERDVSVNNFLDVRALAYFVDIFTFDQASHVSILVASTKPPRARARLTKATGGCPPDARTWPGQRRPSTTPPGR